jgi:hypothetical protein
MPYQIVAHARNHCHASSLPNSFCAPSSESFVLQRVQDELLRLIIDSEQLPRSRVRSSFPRSPSSLLFLRRLPVNFLRHHVHRCHQWQERQFTSPTELPSELHHLIQVHSSTLCPHLRDQDHHCQRPNPATRQAREGQRPPQHPTNPYQLPIPPRTPQTMDCALSRDISTQPMAFRIRTPPSSLLHPIESSTIPLLQTTILVPIPKE